MKNSKMKSIRFLFLVLASILSVSCEHEGLTPIETSDKIEIVASIGEAQTKVSQTADNRYVFNNGDDIHVIGWYGNDEPWKENTAEWWNDATSTYNGKNWETEPNMRWQNDVTNHFFAWYPAAFANSGEDLTAVEFNILKAPVRDVLWARKSLLHEEGDNRLFLDFNHLMSRFEVCLKFKGQYENISDISVKVMDMSASATIDLMGSPEPYISVGNETEPLLLTRKAKDVSAEYDFHTSDIVIPQRISQIQISFTHGNGNAAVLNYVHQNGMNLISGSYHTLKLEVGSDVVTLNGVNVTPWTEKTVEVGEAEEIVTPVAEIPYLTFTADDAQTMSVKIKGSYTLDQSLQYSVNNGNWESLTANSAISFGGNNGTLRLRGKSATGMSADISKYAQITFGSKIVPVACSGDIRTLVDYENYLTADTEQAQFCYLFNGCTNLTSAPTLPSQSLAQKSYYGMFYGCEALTAAPELPATVLTTSCYYSMFYGCKSLSTAPALPAEALADMCYYNMFYGCTALTNAPQLPATTLAKSCYANMFNGCTALTTAPELKATTLANNCCEKMFYGCKNLTAAPALPATVLAEKCYYYMFSGCSAVTSAPALPATTLAKSCYEYMFYNCACLTTASALPATALANRCYYSMYRNCPSLTSAPELPATMLTEYCYYYMFYGCTNLNSFTILATDISAANCLSNCLKNVAGTGTFYKAAEMDESAFDRNKIGIPTGWTITDCIE